ncbi:MAG: PEP-CTERM sorting domain-containing protein [Verrucomicrobiales bacterium]
MKSSNLLTLITAVGLSFTTARGAFLVEVDIDGADDGTISFSPNFSFGGDTTTASQSVAGTAVGLTGGDSIFGGDGTASPDTYVFSYTPGLDVDNLTLAAGTDLNGTDSASAIVGGTSGIYNIYATWPTSANVSGGDTTFSLTHDGGTLTSSFDQNAIGDVWVNLGQATFTTGNTYSLEQTSVSNTFVSMRGAAVMFEAASPVPEPSTAALLLGSLTACALRRRR